MDKNNQFSSQLLLLVGASMLVVCGGQTSFQKLRIYNAETAGNNDHVGVHTNFPDIGHIEHLLGELKTRLYICYTGRWAFCAPNYGDFGPFYPCRTKGSSSMTEICEILSLPSGIVKSFRHIGPPNLTKQSIYLYTDEYFGGQEYVLEEGQEYLAGIDQPINSLATSGFSNWTLYEGPNFDGFSRCLTSTQDLHEYYTLNSTLRTIGSIAPGCVSCAPQKIIMFPNNFLETVVG